MCYIDQSTSLFSQGDVVTDVPVPGEECACLCSANYENLNGIHAISLLPQQSNIQQNK